MLFFNFNTPDTKPLVVSSTVESPLGIKFVTTWNGSLVGTVTFIVLTTWISIVSSFECPYKSVALYLALYTPSLLGLTSLLISSNFVSLP